MTIGKNEDGSGVIHLTAKEFSKFQTGDAIDKHTNDSTGKAVIRVQSIHPLNKHLRLVILDREDNECEINELTPEAKEIICDYANSLVAELEFAAEED